MSSPLTSDIQPYIIYLSVNSDKADPQKTELIKNTMLVSKEWRKRTLELINKRPEPITSSRKLRIKMRESAEISAAKLAMEMHQRYEANDPQDWFLYIDRNLKGEHPMSPMRMLNFG